MLRPRTDKRKRGRYVRCSCGCRQLVYVIGFYDGLRHHFVNREHRTRFLRAQRDRTYPADAPLGSKKREILDALRRVLAAQGTREVERIGKFPRNTVNRYARGNWTLLAPATVEYLSRVIPDVLDPADPRLQGLLDTHDVRVRMGRRGDLADWRKKHPHKHKHAIQKLRDQRLGTPNPGTAAAKRAEWANADREKKETFLATARRRRHLPSEQIQRAVKRMVAQCKRQGRTPTDEDAWRYGGRQASDLGLTRQVVFLYINRERGVLDRPGPLPDIDFLCMIRDLREQHPQTTWDEIAAEVNARFGSDLDPDDVERDYRRNSKYLGPRRRSGGVLWSDDEDAYLRTHLKLTDTSIGRHLGRSTKAVRLRRRTLGLWKYRRPA